MPLLVLKNLLKNRAAVPAANLPPIRLMTGPYVVQKSANLCWRFREGNSVTVRLEKVVVILLVEELLYRLSLCISGPNIVEFVMGNTAFIAIGCVTGKV